MVKIGKDCFVADEQIRLFCQAGLDIAKKHIEYAAKNDRPIFRLMSSRKAAGSVIVMDDYSVYITDLSTQTLSARLRDAQKNKDD